MADALVSGTSARKGVEVRVLFFAPVPLEMPVEKWASQAAFLLPPARADCGRALAVDGRTFFLFEP
jgi:hypothetical protein